jgi:exodeoxyribonuclease-3
LKIATWNVNSLSVRLPQVLQWLVAQQPDILALQEIKMVDAKFPFEEIAAAGYRAVCSGQKTYNGVAILSRHAASDVQTDLPGLQDPQRRILAATFGGVRVLNLYVPNGQSVDSEKYAYKLDWLRQVTQFVQQQLVSYPQLVVLGDFNIAPEDRDVHDPLSWQGQVLCSEPEREAFRLLLQTGLCDTFRLFEQAEGLFSWWDYRMAAFRRNFGLRIDHVLASPAMCAVCSASYIDKAPRAWERPSDHTPVAADFNLS